MRRTSCLIFFMILHSVVDLKAVHVISYRGCICAEQHGTKSIYDYYDIENHTDTRI